MNYERFYPAMSAEYLHGAAVDEAFQVLERCGRAGVFLYDVEEPSPAAWRRAVADAWLMELRDGGERAAYGIINGWTGRAAFVHFCVLPRFDACFTGLARDWLSWLFSLDLFDALLGATPRCYRHVLPRLPAIGFVRRLVVPGAAYLAKYKKYTDTVVTMCTPQSFKEATRAAQDLH